MELPAVYNAVRGNRKFLSGCCTTSGLVFGSGKKSSGPFCVDQYLFEDCSSSAAGRDHCVVAMLQANTAALLLLNKRNMVLDGVAKTLEARSRATACQARYRDSAILGSVHNVDRDSVRCQSENPPATAIVRHPALNTRRCTGADRRAIRRARRRSLGFSALGH